MSYFNIKFLKPPVALEALKLIRRNCVTKTHAQLLTVGI